MEIGKLSRYNPIEEVKEYHSSLQQSQQRQIQQNQQQQVKSNNKDFGIEI